MCRETTITYSCRHTENSFTRCKNSYPTHAKKKQGFFKSLFSSSTSNPKPKPCRVDHEERRVRGMCTHCRTTVSHQQAALDKMEGKRYISAREYNHTNPTDALVARDKRLLDRQTFRCSRCTAEGRHPSPRNRESNSGLCCDYGRREWEGPRGQAHRDLTPSNTTSRRPHDHLARPPVPPKDVHVLKRAPDIRKSVRDARAAASEAARGYNWNREAEIEPGLVRAYTNLSGTDRNALPTELVPLINWDEWNDMPRTAYGRYPTAPPAPSAPLPTRPLRPGRRDVPSRIQTPEPRWITPAPLNVRRPATPESMDIYDVSRPTSPSPRSDSPVSPMTGTFPRGSYLVGEEPGRYQDPEMDAYMRDMRRDNIERDLEDAIGLWGEDAVRRWY